MVDARHFVDIFLGVTQTGKTSLALWRADSMRARFGRVLFISTVDLRRPPWAEFYLFWPELTRRARELNHPLLLVDECDHFLTDGFLLDLAKRRNHVHMSAMLVTQRPQEFGMRWARTSEGAENCAALRDLARNIFLFRLSGDALGWVRSLGGVTKEQLAAIERFPAMSCYRYDVGQCRIVEKIKVRYWK